MKKNVFQLVLVAVIALTAVSCKNERQNQTDAQEAQDALSASESAIVYNVDTSNSTIEWKGRKPTGTHTGTINISSGTINTTEENTIESGDFTIDMKSIVVTDLAPGEGKEDLEAHLMGTVKEQEGDFFNVNKYPESKFEVTGVRVSDGKTWLQGNLTMKEEVRNIEFPVNVSLNGDKMMLQSEPFNIDRTQWGVNYGSKSIFDNLGDKFINDDMEITILVEANKA